MDLDGLNDIVITERRAVVAYCDVTGFMNWLKRSNNSQNDVTVFIRMMKGLFRSFRIETGHQTIPIGDGIIALVLDHMTPGILLRFLHDILRLQIAMHSLIKTTSYPRPSGFRVRVTAGIIYRIDEPAMTVGDVVISASTDFLGDCINLGARLCEVRRELPSIIHQSATELLSEPERGELQVRAITITDRPPRGVDLEDMHGLSTFGDVPAA